MGSPEVLEDRGTAVKEVISAVTTFHSKLPVLEKSKLDEYPTKHATDALSKMVGLETLYSVLSEEHLGLQITLKEVTRRLRQEECKRRDLEARLAATKHENPINLALAERIQILEQSEAKLRRENIDLRDENDLLEFRILEMDENSLQSKRPCNNKVQPDTKSELIDRDDVSDSGVMSLPTSDDEHHEFNLEARPDRDVKSRLLSMCQKAATVSERICLQQALALLRHYEARIEGLEATTAAMCHEATMPRTMYKSDRLLESELDEKVSSSNANTNNGRIIATVLPFTEPLTSDILCPSTSISKLNDCLPQIGSRCRTQADSLTESGVFEAEDEEDDDDEDDLVVSLYTRGTQTEASCQSGEDSLTAELEKLSRIRERMEEKKGECSQQPQLKDVLFYESRVSALEARLAVFESSGDERNKVLSAQLERETLLSAQVHQLKERLARLSAENRRLEEERSELEEMENDTRLRCQKLELKVSALSDKKKGLKKLVEDLRKEMAGRESERRHISRMEALVNSYEQKNQELEEKELEVRYRLQMLENTMPALMMWNLWRVMMLQTGGRPVNMPTVPGIVPSSFPLAEPDNTPLNREEELMAKLKGLENKLNTETRLLEDSRLAEDQLRLKIKELENMLITKDNNIMEILNRDPEEDQEVFDRLSKLAKERIDMDRRIKDLELKEKLYQETLHQADAMFAKMEGTFVKQMKEKDDIINESEEKLAESEGRLKQAMKTSALTSKLQEKLDNMDQQVCQLKEKLLKKEQEREKLEREERKLHADYRENVEELHRLKETVEGPLMNQLELQKKKTANLERELSESEISFGKEREQHQSEVSALQSQIKHLSREILENEVTIGELREEVQTLEIAVVGLRSALAKAESDKEELKEVFEAKLEEKESQLEEAKKILTPVPPPRSLKEEFDDIIILEGQASEAIAQEILTAKGEYRLVKVEDMINITSEENEDRISENVFLQPEVEWPIMEPPSSPPPPPPIGEEPPEIYFDSQWIDVDENNMVTTVFAVNESELENSKLNEHSVQYFLPTELVNTSVGEELPLFVTNLSAECEVAQKAVTGASGRNLPKAMENLSKAYQHSKTCKKCNETLGEFLGDIIQQLGVKLPRVKDLGDRDAECMLLFPSFLTIPNTTPGNLHH
ncbi:uncharacterized protein isoform X3 [Rhodnius prolixus]|uniref:uncharacterized protein isoform X3 n=1 Tax=Rhodnius prolixus TaxID=13249 RepID=UPI003D189C59